MSSSSLIARVWRGCGWALGTKSKRMTALTPLWVHKLHFLCIWLGLGAGLILFAIDKQILVHACWGLFPGVCEQACSLETQLVLMETKRFDRTF
jgi:hypothetical protein